jgi:glycosyltransferase involved in cell wall biosynthesis
VPRYRVAMVITRSLEGNVQFGRVRCLRATSEALGAAFELKTYRLHNLLETRKVVDMLGAAFRALLALARFRPLALQALLYSPGNEIRRLVREIAAGQFHAIYLDSVRCQSLLRILRKRLPDTHIVVDFDDLMSRRMELLSAGQHRLSLGFLRELVPSALRHLSEGPLSGWLTRYEATALRHAEFEMARSAQVVVLVSSAERDLMRARVPQGSGASMVAIPPPAPAVRAITRTEPPYRFVFIGSDRLVQNRLSIDFLVQLWDRLRPSIALHIYGRQERVTPTTPNVHWHGYVDDLSDVYSSGSILLLPALLSGGVKTKVIEAWAHGRPVLGNAAAFEGLDISDYPLTVPESQWQPYIQRPDTFESEWTEAAQMGHQFVRSALSADRYASRWVRIMTPPEDSQVGVTQGDPPRSHRLERKSAGD